MTAKRDSTTWPTGEALVHDIRSTAVQEGTVAFWHLGQASWIVKSAHATIAFDLFLMPSSDSLQRRFEPPVDASQVDFLDAAFCSHDHLDHLDPFAVAGIAKASRHTVFVVPECAAAQTVGLVGDPNRVVVGKVDSIIDVAGLQVRTVPAAHGTNRDPVAECVWERDPEIGWRFVGFVVDLGGVRVYHAGDSEIYPGMVERLAPLGIDVALLPINGRDWFRERHGIIGNMDEREAAYLAHAIGARVLVPMHYDMFAGNPGSPGRLIDLCATQFPSQAVVVPGRCMRWTYRPE
jgi:L-ascorbate 6-phosphate lactonase